MRRHPFIAAYLILLALSTLLRIGYYLLSESGPARASFDRAVGPPAVMMGDAANGWRARDGTAAAGLAGHSVALVRDGVDPAAVLTPPDGARVDLVAFGTAGPAAVALAAGHPDRVRSLTLVDADGVEEFDLLGDHNLNHVLRHAQVVATSLAEWLLPHFFLLDGVLESSKARAARLLAYDRRGLRDQLARWDGPTAIFSTDRSRNGAATAREYARLLPQASLGAWSPDSLRVFLARVDAGGLPTRATADPGRIAAAALPFDAHGLPSAEGSALFAILLLLALTTLLSEDLACVTAGVLAARGSIPLTPAIIGCYVGIVAGDQLLYLLGRSLGRAIVTRAPFRWLIGPAELERAQEWFKREGMRVVITSRLLPGTRFPVYVTAGILRGGFVRFALWLMAVGAIWTPLAVGGSYWAARRGRNLVESLPGATWPWVLGAILLLVFILRVIPPLVGRLWAPKAPPPPAAP